jgi:tetratricopeptide (TPR) repeat protein
VRLRRFVDRSPDFLKPELTFEPRPIGRETARYLHSFLIMRILVGALGVMLPLMLILRRHSATRAAASAPPVHRSRRRDRVRHLSGGGIAVGVTERVKVAVEWGSLAGALTLVECYQAQGRTEEAIGILQQLAEAEPSPALILSLCDLYAETEAWDEIVDAAAGVANEDDITLEIRLLQARALREQGLDEAALGVYKDALRSKKRDPELLKDARYERGTLLLARGRTAQAMKDLQAVYADDPHHRDVAALVQVRKDGGSG